MKLLVFGIVLHSIDQIDDHRNVDDEDDDSADANVLDDLVQFERDERSGGDDRQIFGPLFFEQQADAFGSQQRHVEEAPGADRFELVRAEEAELDYQRMNVMVVA